MWMLYKYDTLQSMRKIFVWGFKGAIKQSLQHILQMYWKKHRVIEVKY